MTPRGDNRTNDPSPERSIELAGAITEASATSVISRILVAKKLGVSHEITIYMNSVGGDMNPTFAIYEMIRELRPLPEIFGQRVAGSAILLFVACRPGCRVLHERAALEFVPVESTNPDATSIQAARALSRKIASHTRATPEQVEVWLNGSYRMPATEALALGFCDGLRGDQ